jgi:hypothetical protein
LQRHGKIAAAFGIFCRKPAAEENRHRQRIVRLATGSSRDRSSMRVRRDGVSYV